MVRFFISFFEIFCVLPAERRYKSFVGIGFEGLLAFEEFSPKLVFLFRSNGALKDIIFLLSSSNSYFDFFLGEISLNPSSSTSFYFDLFYILC